jgi:ATP phosphoribosyltransferase
VKKLKLGIPKGSLQESTFKLMKKAGYNISVSSRSYVPSIDDAEIDGLMLRAQEIPRYVEIGVLDAGITGKDWTLEQNAKVVIIDNFIYAKEGLRPVRWVLAVPVDSPIKSIKDLRGKRIATELVNFTKRYFKKLKISVDVEFSWGATEAKAPSVVDAIVELTETGSSLRANNLRIVETLLESTTVMIANKDSWKDEWKREKIKRICLLMQGAILAEDKVGLKMNVPDRCLSAVFKKLPALQKPTVAPLSEKGWFSVEVIVDEKIVRDLIPELKKAGASGIVEYSLNKVIY